MITVYGNNTTHEQLVQYPLVKPERCGRFWQGIAHKDLADAVAAEVESRKWEIADSQFSVSKDTYDLAGAFLLKTPEIKVPEGQTLALGVLTSNNMKRKLRMVVGTNVACCNNGMATGEVVLTKKHTSGLDLGKEIQEGIDRYIIKAQEITGLVERLQGSRIRPRQAEHILMEAGRQGLMPWSRIGDVDQEYRNPRFAEHGVGTSWALLQAFTYVVKRNPPLNQMDQMNAFRGLLPLAQAA